MEPAAAVAIGSTTVPGRYSAEHSPERAPAPIAQSSPLAPTVPWPDPAPLIASVRTDLRKVGPNSKAPISQLPFCGRATPRASVSNRTTPAAQWSMKIGTWSSAGLPVRRAIVGAKPPLFRSCVSTTGPDQSVIDRRAGVKPHPAPTTPRLF